MNASHKILCVCLGNRSRSPMMAALLRQIVGASYTVESAGVRREVAGLPADPRAVRVTGERGIDLGSHISRWTGDLDLADYRHFICVDAAIAARLRALAQPDAMVNVIVANAAGNGIPDPFDGGIAGYRTCLALLDLVMPDVAAAIIAAD